MKIYLLILSLALACSFSSNKCLEAGSSPIGKFSSCKFITGPPQLQWALNVTLTQDYNWQGADDVKYAYLTIDDQPISETCYPGQTIKGKYSKGTVLLVEHLCFNFSPFINKGDKVYLLVFSSQGGDGLVVYITFDGAGWVSQEPTEEDKAKARRYANKNLVVEE